MIQTTSPSYILLCSLDYALAYMRDKGEQEIYRVTSLLQRFEEMVCALPGFSCPEITQSGVVARDPLKSVIDVSGTGHSGLTIKAMLAREGIHVEAADMKHIMLMLSVGNTAAHLDRLYETLRRTERIRGRSLFFSPYSMPVSTKYSQSARNWGQIEKLRLEHAPGRVSASTAGVYPPAEAVVLRGQVISYEIAGYLIEANRQGFELFGVEDASINVYKERS
jgi:arginine/lysine/ornithine decarboxylase